MTQQFTRRRTLGAFGTVSLGALLSACGGQGPGATTQPPTAASAAERFEGAATCTLTPEQVEGPYYFDVDMIRSDIREDRQGVPLRLVIRVQDAARCAPIANAVVDIWHCDPGGIYSGFEAASRAAQGAGPPSGRSGPTDQETYLRGAQVTNSDGIVEFTTVYPGWYTGRTVHIHAKAHLDSSTLVTTQLYFDEAVTAQVYAQPPYSQRAGRDTFNDTDWIIDTSGSPPMLTLSQDGEGWLGLITIGVDRT